jgi:hypothetical protein
MNHENPNRKESPGRIIVRLYVGYILDVADIRRGYLEFY